MAVMGRERAVVLKRQKHVLGQRTWNMERRLKVKVSVNFIVNSTRCSGRTVDWWLLRGREVQLCLALHNKLLNELCSVQICSHQYYVASSGPGGSEGWDGGGLFLRQTKAKKAGEVGGGGSVISVLHSSPGNFQCGKKDLWALKIDPAVMMGSKWGKWSLPL